MMEFVKRVMCIGDSLSLPGHLNRYDDTWYFKLKEKFPRYDFNSYFKRQLTTDVLVSMGGGQHGIDSWPKGADCLEAYMPDIVIVQLGIVDCAPRLLSNFDRIVINMLPGFLSMSYISFVKIIRRRKSTNTLVPLNKFQSNWTTFLARALKINAKVIIISISLPDQKYIEKNPDVCNNINQYNDILFSLARVNNNVTITNVLDPDKYDHLIYEDGYHPNKFGHQILFNQLIHIL